MVSEFAITIRVRTEPQPRDARLPQTAGPPIYDISTPRFLSFSGISGAQPCCWTTQASSFKVQQDHDSGNQLVSDEESSTACFPGIPSLTRVFTGASSNHSLKDRWPGGPDKSEVKRDHHVCLAASPPHQGLVTNID